ncbi:hypothetical protein GUJ93_ZPchr0001g31211 [Zizania palustris]|uniref:Uncharacterized protein n=1 Tax=Zizania palustris TaxID=103762 RepID=A0A8J5RTM8_ZIZPA|nr:hypothetical protein GUJ93_ZPchr0001g31211 [Zizania palustris]
MAREKTTTVATEGSSVSDAFLRWNTFDSLSLICCVVIICEKKGYSVKIQTAEGCVLNSFGFQSSVS